MALLWAYFANGFGQPKNPDYSLYLLSLGYIGILNFPSGLPKAGVSQVGKK